MPVESDGRPRGSFNRWNYNEVYRSPTPTPGGDAQVSWDTSAANNESYHRRWRQSLRYRTYSTTPPPTPGHRVEQDAKHDVDWAYDSSSFYLRVSVTHLRTHTHMQDRVQLGSAWPKTSHSAAWPDSASHIMLALLLCSVGAGLVPQLNVEYHILQLHCQLSLHYHVDSCRTIETVHS